MESLSHRLLTGAVVCAAAGIIGCALTQPVSASDAVTYREFVLHAFVGGADGAAPQAGLIDLNGSLYGTTSTGGGTGCGGSGCGTVFSVDPSSGAETVLYSFCRQQNCADGANPVASLIAIKGMLYGTTFGGGANCESSGCGTVFSIDPGTGIEKVVYSFCSKQGCTDGESPSAGLLNVKGTLYGTTYTGGINCGDGCIGAGTVFSLDPGSGTETVLYSFCPDTNLCADGAFPNAGLVNAKGNFYGTTYMGGNSTYCFGFGCGTVFAIDPKTGTETVVHSFCHNQGGCTDGVLPLAGLIDRSGTLYGTTYYGGANGSCQNLDCGTVFSLNPSTGTETVTYSLCAEQNCTDGADPQAGVIDVKGILYGTTVRGGKAGCTNNLGCGTVFSVDPNTGTETVLHNFCAMTNCMDGANPVGGLIAVNGDLYGTTESGGGTGCSGTGCGTVFVLKKKHLVSRRLSNTGGSK